MTRVISDQLVAECMDALECEGNNAIRILHRNHKAATLAEYSFFLGA